jgi:hypothetical protein
LFLCFLPWLLANGAALGEVVPEPLDPALLAAEHQRLSGEIEQLARRQAWIGAEQRFGDLDRLGIEPSYEDLVFGAHAARGLGDAQSARDRLKQACQIEPTDELRAWLLSLDSAYGHAVLTSSTGEPVELRPAALPFAPDARAAVDYAVRLLAAEGRFEGLLPVGEYSLAGTGFRVEAGLALQIEISARQARQARRRGGESGPGGEAAPVEEPAEGGDATLH